MRVKNMNAQKIPQNVLEDMRVRMKLAALWTSFMFLYIYVDYFHLYMPGSVKDLLAGKIWVFDVTQVFLLIALASVTIPALMIFLSVALSAKVNRWTNVIVAAVYIPYTLFNLAGEAWVHMYFAAVVEVVLLLLIIRYAWKWRVSKGGKVHVDTAWDECAHWTNVPLQIDVAKGDHPKTPSPYQINWEKNDQTIVVPQWSHPRVEDQNCE
jgi:Family of unknown function (DUF6326)